MKIAGSALIQYDMSFKKRETAYREYSHVKTEAGAGFMLSLAKDYLGLSYETKKDPPIEGLEGAGPC